MPSRASFVAAFVLSTLALVPLFGQTPSVVIVFKGPGYEQTSPTAVSPKFPGYGALVSFSSSVSSTTTLQLTGPGVAVAIPKTTADTFYTERYFDSIASLDAAMPDGSYTLSVFNGSAVASTTPLIIPPAADLGVTRFTNYAATQTWSGGPLTLEWDPIPGATRGDLIRISVDRGADATTIYESPSPGEAGALDGSSTSFTIPSLNVATGERLNVQMSFLRLNLSFANNNRTVVAAGRGFFLRLPFARALPARPTIAIQPRAQTVVAGNTVVFWVGASDGSTYQWRRNGVPIAGATNATYILPSVQAASEGFFTVDVGNIAGSVTSDSVALTVLASSANPGRISNLAIRSQAGSGAATLIVGAAVGGAGTTGTKPLLLRGVGPALVPFGVTGTLTDPRLEVFSGSTKIAENDNWGGDAQVTAIGSQVGAFALGAATGRDAALYNPAFPSGTFSMQVTGAGSGSGVALAEIYDATPASAFQATTPRLTNVSARTQVGTGGDVLIAGFTISGGTAKTVLVRAIGPTLGAFGVNGALNDPRLDLFSGSTLVHANDNWGGDTQLATAFASAGAFPISAGSRDAAVIVTLPPGGYTAQVSGVNNTTGVALIEVYELP